SAGTTGRGRLVRWAGRDWTRNHWRSGMNHLIRARSPFILFLMCAMLALTIQSPVARAAMVPTGDYLRQEQMGAERARLMDALRDEQVAAKLQQLGIPPEMVERRIQRLTSEEVALLNERIDELPAGG